MKKLGVIVIFLVLVIVLGRTVDTAFAITTDPPLNVQVSDNTRTDGINITWDDNPEAGSGRSNGVVILYRLKGASSFSKLTNVPDGTNAYLWTHAVPGTEYEFQIGYCGANPDFYLCDTPWFYLFDGTIYPGTRQLTTPAGFSASSGTVGTGISLNWFDHSQQGTDGFYYKIMSSTSEFGPYVLRPAVYQSYWLDTSMDPLKSLYYRVYACRDKCSEPAADSGMRGLPNPSNLVITDDINGVYLDWDPISQADYYVVSRSLTSPLSYSQIGTPSVSAFADTTSSLNVEYRYRVKACSTVPAVCSGYTGGFGMRGIDPPVLSAKPSNPDITLTWEHTDVGDTTEYRIWRAPAGFLALEDFIAIIPETGPNQYVDMTAVEGTEYRYRIKACKNDGSLVCSENSNFVFVQWDTCYRLTLDVIGSGAVPKVDPTHSSSCPGGDSLLYSEGQYINLYDYDPDFGWVFDKWIGTFSPSSDVAIMPASDHTVTAVYVSGNQPPYQPSNPSPVNTGTGILIGADLSWTGGDPNGDTVTYDVYFGTNATPTTLVCNDAVSANCALPTLAYDTTYYWYVVATDEYSDSNTGSIWEFTTETDPGALAHDDINTPEVIPQHPYQDIVSDSSTATSSPGDPVIAACNLAPGLATVWYEYTPGADQSLYVDTFGSSYDTFLAVWSGTPGSLTPVACSDDADGKLQSRVHVELTGGTTYYIEVGQYNGLQSGSPTKPLPSVAGGGMQISTATFMDVPSSYLFYPYIEAFYAEGITGGCSLSPLQFCPSNSVTRAQMAVFMLKAKHGPTYTPPPATGIFTDVPDNFFRPWIEAFYAEGITGGCSLSPLKFCPNGTVTRAQMAIFLLKAKYGAPYTPPPATGIFTDVPDNFFRPWIEAFYAEGITGGCSLSPLKFCPNNGVTRGQMAVFIDKGFGFTPIP